MFLSDDDSYVCVDDCVGVCVVGVCVMCVV